MVIDSHEEISPWSTASTMLRSDACKAPFWLPAQAISHVDSVHKHGVSDGPKLWVIRSEIETAAIEYHGASDLSERRRAAVEGRTTGPPPVSNPDQREAYLGVVVLLHGAGDSGVAIKEWALDAGLGEELERRTHSSHR